METATMAYPNKATDLSAEMIILNEMQHRMKNDLQLILSLINLQLLDEHKTANEDFLLSLKNRVQAMSVINKCLSFSFDKNKVSIDGLLNNLIDSVYKAYCRRDDVIVIRHIDKIELENKFAIPIGLIVNELLTNALKHAFPNNYTPTDNKYCEIVIILKKLNNKFELTIKDNGISKLENLIQAKSTSKGLLLVSSFIDQLEGSYSIKNACGTDIQIEFYL